MFLSEVYKEWRQKYPLILTYGWGDGTDGMHLPQFSLTTSNAERGQILGHNRVVYAIDTIRRYSEDISTFFIYS